MAKLLAEMRGRRSTEQGGSLSRALTGIGHRQDDAEELGPDTGRRPTPGGPGQEPPEPRGPRGPRGRRRKTGGVRTPLG